MRFNTKLSHLRNVILPEGPTQGPLHGRNHLESGVFIADTSFVDILAAYRRDAMKLAVVTELGGNEGYAARIPGFRGLVTTGRTRKEAIAELNDALLDWTELALRRGIGLPSVKQPIGQALTAA